MNDHTISLVRESFDLVTPIAPQAAALTAFGVAQFEQAGGGERGRDALARERRHELAVIEDGDLRLSRLEAAMDEPHRVRPARATGAESPRAGA